MSVFSKRLKELRKNRRLTQKELGKALFIDDTSISKYENEKAMPENELLQRIADYFEVSLDYLLGRSDESQVSVNNENKNNKKINEIIEDFEISLETATMPNGENMDEKSKELLKQNLRYICEWILSKNK